MNVKKTDVINIAREVQSSQNDIARQDKAPTATSGSQGTQEKSLQVDTLRSQVLAIQHDVKELQTQISFRQVQIAFLEQLKENSNWKNELQRFMQERFNGTRPSDIQADSLSEFTRQTLQSINSLNNALLKKEIQLQNILSTGILPEGQLQVSLFKDLSSNSDVFAKLKPDAVSALLKQS